jgi:hypothetical protein
VSGPPEADQPYLDQQFAAIGRRPFVVVSDTHFADNYEIYCKLADYLLPADIVLALVTDCQRPERPGIVNVTIGRVNPGVPADLQARYPFSLFKPLVCERSVTDYCTFRQEEFYSGLSLEQFMDRYTRFVNAYEYLFARGGVFVGMLHDTFKSALASRIAEHYARPVLLPIQYYWWPDGVLFFDTAGQGAREIEARYRYYLSHPELIDRRRADAIYAAKAKTMISKAVQRSSFFDKVANVWMSRTSPEPFSLSHFVRRRAGRLLAWGSGALRPDYFAGVNSLDTPFVLFPMHVAPEASILGAAPELADQFGLIKNVSLNLPLGTLLLVKEHPDQHRARLGGLFYRQLASLPNVKLVSASVPALDLIRLPQCAAVMVINGTLGLEAAFEGKPVFVPSGGAAWYSFCGAFETIAEWKDVFRALSAPTRESASRKDITALFLAMDDCVEPMDRTPVGTYTFRDAGEAGAQAIARKVQKVLHRATQVA